MNVQFIYCTCPYLNIQTAKISLWIILCPLEGGESYKTNLFGSDEGEIHSGVLQTVLS